MKLSRRDALFGALFGAGGVGLRAIATGLPASLLLNPRKVLADPTSCTTPGKAQFVVFSTTYSGDPLNANVPGMYEDPNIIHPLDPAMAPTPLTIRGTPYTAAKPWSTLPQNVLDRTVFFHMATGTPVHPKEPQVLQLMGATNNPRGKADMLPSLMAMATGPCLGTVQTQPISFGGSNPTEALSFQGAVMPTIPPTALRDTLTNSATSPLTNLQGLRDQTMNQLYGIYKTGATPPQQQFIDKMVTSQKQARELEQSLLDQLSSIKDNLVGSQFQAALVAIQMKLTPLISVHVPFGGDNHGDLNLQGETSATVSSVAALASFLQSLSALGLQDQVSFISLNVFGRTLALKSKGTNGRDHNGNHQVSLCIGKPFRGGVIGGCAPAHGDYGATNIDSSTGAGSSSGDIQVADTLAAFGQTMLAAVGGDPTLVTSPTAKVVSAALA